MITGLFWWGVWVAIFLLSAKHITMCRKRHKPKEIIENVNQHLYGKMSYKRREHEE